MKIHIQIMQYLQVEAEFKLSMGVGKSRSTHQQSSHAPRFLLVTLSYVQLAAS
jgi:hypothetical protein